MSDISLEKGQKYRFLGRFGGEKKFFQPTLIKLWCFYPNFFERKMKS